MRWTVVLGAAGLLTFAGACQGAAAQNVVVLDQVFGQLDRNGDGALNVEELRAMGGGSADEDARISLMVVMLDADGTGTLSKEEFAVILSGRQRQIDPAQARRLFDHFDSDGSGGIERDEGLEAMDRMASGMSDEQMDEALSTADANGDGVIDFTEFQSISP